MDICRVVKKVVSTIKHDSYTSLPLLLVQPVNLQLKNKGSEILAIDFMGSDVGELVLIMKEGSAVNDLLGTEESPVDAAIIAIIDSIDADERKIYDKANAA